MTTDEIKQLNMILGKQILQMIVDLFGHSRPFVTLLPGLPEEPHAGIVGNIEREDLHDVLNEAMSSVDESTTEASFSACDSKAEVS